MNKLTEHYSELCKETPSSQSRVAKKKLLNKGTAIFIDFTVSSNGSWHKYQHQSMSITSYEVGCIIEVVSSTIQKIRE